MRKLIAILCLVVITTPNLSGAQEQGISNFNHINEIISLIKNNVDYNFKHSYTPLITEGKKEGANAFALGRFIIVRKPVLDILTQRELTAVIAHELAHSEKSHLLKRIGNYIGLPVVHFFRSTWLKLKSKPTQGNLKEHRKFLGTMIRDMSDAMEMQADCYAYQWLRELQEQGFDVSPQDLNAASTKLLGVDFSKYMDMDIEEYTADLPPFQRFKQIRLRNYESINCGTIL